ncbi:O-antigen ligase family protein [Paenibacillus sp. Soil750]|uniref:O-antigen ligase family protein n=1 Tax=Paenibacillus sp. Soil750 TaxID=1736398 RepID=UPI0006F36AE7|nr:O-antigen ligase family protein [Paenibacillus sp. Soil750]KRE57655.1 hypothetical protein ASL11_32655 [Paenibacillus sp. Soil750]
MINLLDIKKNPQKEIQQKEIGFLQYVILVVFAVSIEIAFYAGETLDNKYLSFFAIGLLIISSCFLNMKNNMYLLLFLLPNQRYIVFPGDETTLLNILIIIMLFKLISSKGKFYIPSIILMQLLILYSLNIVMRLDSVNEVLIIVKMCITIVTLVGVFSRYAFDNSFYYNCVKFLGIGCLFASCIALFGNDEAVIGATSRFTGGINNNSNIFGAVLSFSITSIFIIILTSIKQSKLLITLTTILFIFGLLTESRSFVLAISFAIIYILVFGAKLSSRTRKLIMCLLILIGIFIVVSITNPSSQFGEIFSSVTNRIINPKNGDLSNGRTELWYSYIKFLTTNIEYLFLGIGNNWKNFGFANVAHNGVLEVTATYGLIGLILIVSLLFINWRKLRGIYLEKSSGNIKKRRVLYYLPLFTLGITNLTGHDFFNLAFVIHLFMSCACIYSLNSNVPQKQEI